MIYCYHVSQQEQTYTVIRYLCNRGHPHLCYGGAGSHAPDSEKLEFIDKDKR